MSKAQSNPAIGIIHPNRLFLESLATLLQSNHYKISIQATAFQPDDLQPLLPSRELVMLVGGQTPAEVAETVESLRRELQSARILVIGIKGEPYEVMLALQAGADGFLPETMTFQTLMSAIELVVQDETVLPTGFVKSLAVTGSLTDIEFRPCHYYEKTSLSGCENALSETSLSRRQKSILQGLVDGVPNKVIANRLSITESTVKIHVRALLRKIRVKNRTQAAMWAIKNNHDEGTKTEAAQDDSRNVAKGKYTNDEN